MLSKTKNLIVKSISDIFKIERNQIQSQLELCQCPKTDLPEFQFHINKNCGLLTKQMDCLINLTKTNYDKSIIENVRLDLDKTTTKVVFKLNQKHFVNNVLSSATQNIELENKRRVVVEFSSPNIAKPFHVGHLRSTIIGNFIANLNKCMGNEVVKLNYLGDWGTQFGMLQIGIEMSGLSDIEIQKNPIENMYKSYVMANNAAKSNPKIIENARILFTELETEKYSIQRKRWEQFRKYTIDELRATYSRLGIVFDQYDWESQYSQKNIQNVIQQLEDSGVLIEEFDGRKIIEVDERRVPVIKSDGSTLYLIRDIAALLDRYERYKFDKIFYIVDNAQTDHFKALFYATPNIVKDLHNRTMHVKFGRIKGMSTRSGNAVFLKDVLNEARDIMLSKQNESPTTKVNLDHNESRVSDVLGISAVIINDLKQRRQKDYDFNWNKVLQVNGDTGIKLQYTHCRLVSLLENVSIKPADEPNYELLGEKDAINLIITLGKYPETLKRSLETLEACILVNYLFALSNSISRALKRLNVIHEKSSDVQEQRVLLFKQSKCVLNSGMKILGLQPLNKM